MPRVLILGTGTGIGKTFVTEAVARALGRAGQPVLALKPIETGLAPLGPDAAPPPTSDAGRLEAASFHVTPPRPHPLYALERPVSPHLAAADHRVTISAAAVARWLTDSTASRDSTLHVLLETAGGAFSPISDAETNADLIGACQPDRVVLVAPDALGVLHDTRATLLALTTQGRRPDAVVLSQARPPDASTGTNAVELERLGIAERVFLVRAGRPDDARAVVDWLQSD